jgi:hypothetical protein
VGDVEVGYVLLSKVTIEATRYNSRVDPTSLNPHDYTVNPFIRLVKRNTDLF